MVKEIEHVNDMKGSIDHIRRVPEDHSTTHQEEMVESTRKFKQKEN
jgi:hypothetical protein